MADAASGAYAGVAGAFRDGSVAGAAGGSPEAREVEACLGGSGGVSGSARRPGARDPESLYWLIVRGAAGRNTRQMDVFSFDFEGERLAPVFSDGEQAETFARLEAPGWQPRLCSRGEMISLMSGRACGAGPCAGVKGVALDPPEGLGKAGFEFASMSRARFLDHLTGRGRGWFDDERRRRRGSGGDPGLWETTGPEEASTSDGREESGALR